MCPECLISAGWIVSGAISTGGVSALAVRMLHAKKTIINTNRRRTTMAIATSEKLGTKIVTPAEWLAARKELLAKEKEFTLLRDELSRKRREMP